MTVAPVEGTDNGSGVELLIPVGKPEIVIVGVAVVFSAVADTASVTELFGTIVSELNDNDSETDAAGGLTEECFRRSRLRKSR